jgi:hypothetical protein
LAQRFSTTLPNGKVVERLHPIAFASKRTSKTEQKYKPFLLEFAGLKFTLDKFSDIIWGFPIEIETDCQALRDILRSEKPNAAHARWRDGILAHHIIDVRHVPGKTNVVADGLSRYGEGTENVEGDGSEWTVSEDWEAAQGLVNDVWTTEVLSDPIVTALKERFVEEPLFLEVIDALLMIRSDTNVRRRSRAKHRAEEYFIEEGKLWHLGGGSRARARAKVECVTKKEATELA